MKQLILPIRGMHCHSCELLIEEKLKDVKGVKSVTVSERKACAEIHYEEHAPNHDELSRAVSDAGYSVGQREILPWLSRHTDDYKRLGFAALVLLGLYYLLRSFGVFDISLQTQNMTLPFALVVGLIAGVSTCMALVGGLIAGISARHSELHPEATPGQKFRPHLSFNAGRIIGYAVLGGLLGSLGSVLRLSPFSLALLTLAVGIVMVTLGLKLTGVSPRLARTTISLPSWIGKRLGIKKETKEYSHRGAFVSGALTFFLPCGFTQAMQIYAVSTGQFWLGAAAMGLFAIGTAPALIGIGGLTSVMKGAAAKRFYAVIGLAVFLFGFAGIRNGLALSGIWTPEVSSPSATQRTTSPAVETKNGVQVVRMTQKANGYVPNRFTIRAGIPVRWIITSEADYSCAASIYLSAYGIRRDLTRGENIIEFTPTKTGTLPFSCSMGMYRGSFTVVDQSANAATVQTASAAADPVADSESSCGSGGCGCGGN
ncbi:MAG: sulfite exporter TauE/SafE family protein [bacterium]|nr:sulfite exporter TauE/SafE family protein [bacterium]